MMTFIEFISNLESQFEKTPPNKYLDFFPILAKSDLKNEMQWSNFVNNVLNVMSYGSASKDADRSFNQILPYFKKDKEGTLNLIAHVIINKKKPSEKLLNKNMMMWQLALKNGSLDILDEEPNPEIN